MKKHYVKPRLISEMFHADEYIAACGDGGTVYNFKCDAGLVGQFMGEAYGNYGDVYQETNNVSGLQTGNNGDKQLAKASTLMGYYVSGYHACNATHEAENLSDNTFLQGYYVPDEGTDAGKTIQVIIWRGPNGDNVHCTTNLNINSWETAKS